MRYLPALLRISATLVVGWSIWVPIIALNDGLNWLSHEMAQFIFVAGIPLFVFFLVSGLLLLVSHTSQTEAAKRAMPPALEVPWYGLLAILLLVMALLAGSQWWQNEQKEALAHQLAADMTKQHQKLLASWAQQSFTLAEYPQVRTSVGLLMGGTQGCYDAFLLVPKSIAQHDVWLKIGQYDANYFASDDSVSDLTEVNYQFAVPVEVAHYLQQQHQRGNTAPYILVAGGEATLYLPVSDRANAPVLVLRVGLEATK